MTLQQVTAPIILDSTGHGIVAELGKLVLLKEKELNASVTSISDWGEVSSLVEEGAAVDAFPVGTILHTPWADVRPNVTTEWDFLWRVVHHGTVELRDGETVNAMYLQSKLCLPFATAYDVREAFYAAGSDGLAAGTYHINSGAGYQQMAANTDYQFTLTQDLPAGGQLIFKDSTYSVAPTTVQAFASGSATEATEECAVTVGSGGTSLGTLATNPTDTVNNIHRHVLGSNRWRDSDVRQWLNSSDASWYSPMSAFDRVPALSTYSGFLSGFDSDFAAHVAEVRVDTALPYCDGGTASGTECDTTYDKVFLPSAEQLDWACTWLGVPYGLEGSVWDYWKRVYGATPASMGATHPEFRLASMGSESTMRYVFERSAYRFNGNHVAYCHASGGLSYSSALVGNFCAPACCIV